MTEQLDRVDRAAGIDERGDRHGAIGIGIIAPAGLPPALLQKISADIGQAVRSAEVSARMGQLGMEPVGSTSEQYTSHIRQEIDKWAAVIKTAGIKAE